MPVLQYYCHCRSWWGTCNAVRVGKLLSHGIYCDLIYCVWLIYADWCWMVHMRWVWKLFYDCWCKHVDVYFLKCCWTCGAAYEIKRACVNSKYWDWYIALWYWDWYWLIYFVLKEPVKLHCTHLGRDCRPARLLFSYISLSYQVYYCKLL